MTIETNRYPARWDSTPFNYPIRNIEVSDEQEVSMEEVLRTGHHPMAAAYQLRLPDPTSDCREQCRLFRMTFQSSQGEPVPFLMAIPSWAPSPYPLVVLVHGFFNNKAEYLYWQAPRLTRMGFAVMVPDLPFHGERTGYPPMITGLGDVHQFYRNICRCVIEVRELMYVACQRTEFNTSNGILMGGYSLGAWIASMAGASDSRVKALSLMVHGGTPHKAVDYDGDTEFQEILADRIRLWQTYPEMDPEVVLPYFSPRPILMLNGTWDRLIPQNIAERTYQSAREPKQQIWYESGHMLPPQAYKESALWLWGQWEFIQASLQRSE